MLTCATIVAWTLGAAARRRRARRRVAQGARRAVAETCARSVAPLPKTSRIANRSSRIDGFPDARRARRRARRDLSAFLVLDMFLVCVVAAHTANLSGAVAFADPRVAAALAFAWPASVANWIGRLASGTRWRVCRRRRGGGRAQGNHGDATRDASQAAGGPARAETAAAGREAVAPDPVRAGARRGAVARGGGVRLGARVQNGSSWRVASSTGSRSRACGPRWASSRGCRRDARARLERLRGDPRAARDVSLPRRRANRRAAVPRAAAGGRARFQ